MRKLRRLFKNSEYSFYCLFDNTTPTVVGFLWYCARIPWWWLRYAALPAICGWRGHTLRDEGVATPESGHIEMVCTRCGFSYGTHILY
jgi:hypothetical protein